MLTFQFVPYSEIDGLSSAKRIQKLLNLVHIIPQDTVHYIITHTIKEQLDNSYVHAIFVYSFLQNTLPTLITGMLQL